MADHTFLDVYLEALEDSNSEGSTLDTVKNLLCLVFLIGKSDLHQDESRRAPPPGELADGLNDPTHERSGRRRLKNIESLY